MRERRGFRVLGRVQGVGFRWSVRKRAEELDLHGSVRNTADGAVELCAEGTPEALDQLAGWLRQGPPGARVDSIEQAESELPVPTSGFQIVQ